MASRTDASGRSRAESNAERGYRTYDTSSNTWVGDGVRSFSSDGSQMGGRESGLYVGGVKASPIGWVPAVTKVERQQGSGPSNNVVATPGSVVTTGPGVGGQVTVPSGAQLVERAPVAGGAQDLPVSGPGGPRRQSTILATLTGGPRHGPLRPQMEGSVQELLLGGVHLRADPFTSNAEEWEIRYAEPGEWAGGLVVMGRDLGYNAADWVGWDRERSGRDIRHHLNNLPTTLANGARDFARYVDRVNASRTGAQETQAFPWGPSYSNPRKDSTGTVRFTGGGF